MGRRKHGKLRNPDMRTATLLGLGAVETRLPAASRVKLTAHAVQRFQERCAPDLSLHAARRRLCELKGGARVSHCRPEWAGVDDVTDPSPLGVIGWVILDLGGGERCALPVRVREDGEPFAATCIR